MILSGILGGLAALSLTLLLWQWFLGARFPLHVRTACPPAPAISILKPLKGRDDTTAASLESWMTQHYAGPLQILFGIADGQDPVRPVVEEWLRRHPNCDAQLIVCPERPGINGKMATAAQLEKSARHDLLLVSDADTRVPADFLANMAAPLRDANVALVNCFYRLANPATAAMQWEALAVNADFWSQVLQANSIKPQDFALGAVMLARRKALDEIGGFGALVHCVADDYELGHRIHAAGHSIALCPVVAECWEAPAGWRAVWRHQLRWARTIRSREPLPYFFSILSNATVWGLAAGIAGFAFGPGHPAIGIFGLAVVAVRMAVARRLERRMAGGEGRLSPFWMAPVKDLLQVGVWAAAFMGNTVEWRGQRMRLHRGTEHTEGNAQ